MTPTPEIIDGEVVEDAEVDLTPAVREEATPTLFGTTDPEAVVEAATRAARPLADVVRKQNLSVKIGQSEHVRVEGWTLLGSMLGVFPVCVWTRKIEGDEPGWEARVEARTRSGDLVGAAEAECLRSENTWKGRDDYALRSMAQTRATSKALRQPLGFVMQLAGFNPTPAEEMPRDGGGETDARNRVVVPTGAITAKQHPMLEALISKLGVDRDALKRHYGVEHMTDLTMVQASEAIDRLLQRQAEAEKDLPI